MWENLGLILGTMLASSALYCVLYSLVFYAVTAFAQSRWGHDAKSTWQHYIALNEENRYLYVSYILSAINAVGCLTFMYLGNSNCDPPAAHRRDDVFLGNTYLRNNWCIDNPNIYEVLAIQ